MAVRFRHVQRVAAQLVGNVNGNWVVIGGLVIAGGLLLSAAGIFSSAKEASAGQVPALPAAAVEPPFPEPGSSCYAYFESMIVTGAGSSTVILGYPTEKAVLLSQYAIKHDDPSLLAKAQQVLSKIDAGARLRVIARNFSTVHGTVLDGSSLGQTLFIPQEECHAVRPSSIVQENP